MNERGFSVDLKMSGTNSLSRHLNYSSNFSILSNIKKYQNIFSNSSSTLSLLSFFSPIKRVLRPRQKFFSLSDFLCFGLVRSFFFFFCFNKYIAYWGKKKHKQKKVSTIKVHLCWCQRKSKEDQKLFQLLVDVHMFVGFSNFTFFGSFWVGFSF